MTTATMGTARVQDVDARQVREWLSRGEACLVDVREPFEHAEASIDGAELVPLGGLDPAAVAARAQGRRLVFHCKAGKRGGQAAARAAELGCECFNLSGGIEAWQAAGMPVRRSAQAPKIGVMRQVQMIAGSLVLAGVGLSLVNPWLIGISAFVGAGLVFAGVTGWCGMAKLLAVMPWNKGAARGASCCAS